MKDQVVKAIYGKKVPELNALFLFGEENLKDGDTKTEPR